MEILTAAEFCKKFDMQSRIEQVVKHYEKRNVLDNIVLAYDKDEQGLWHETTERYHLQQEIATAQKELARLEVK